MCSITDFIIPDYVRRALKLLNAAGFESYLVGGCVRDSLLGVMPHDFDITTNARPEQVKAAFTGTDIAVIDTGVKHGTVTAVIDGKPVEITAYRIDGVYTDNRHPVSVKFAGSLSDDLCRRDFTVNAMAYSENGGTVDLFGGADDLRNKVVRCVGEPDKRFREDGLRILRALRFASTLDFSIDGATADAVHRNRSLLENISAERIFAELSKLICGGGAARVLALFPNVFAVVLPELHPERGELLRQLPKDVAVRLALLLYHLDNERSFYCSSIAKNGLARLKTDSKTRADTVKFIDALNIQPPHDITTVRRMMASLGELFDSVLPLYFTQHQSADAVFIKSTAARIIANGDCLTLAQMKLNGRDLLNIGVSQGGEIGRILGALLDEVMEAKVENNRGALLCEAKRMIYEGKTE